MKTRAFLRAFLAVAGLALADAAAPAARAGEPSPASIEQSVLAVNAEMMAAANRLDVDAFFTHIADTGGVLIVQNGVIFRTRQEAYDAVKRGLQGVVKLERRIDHPAVTVLGPDAALLVGDGNAHATLQDGRVMDSPFAVSLVFARTGGTWKLVHGHYSTPLRR